MALTRRELLNTTAGGLATSLLAGSFAFAETKPRIGVVVKIGGIPRFNDMEVGIKAEAEEIGADARMVGPTQSDAAQHVRAIEDLIARKVNVIGIVPNDSAAIAWQKERYPKMTMLGERFGVAESVDDTIRTTQDQLRANPNLTGILTFGSQGPIGAALGLEDREIADKVVLVGGFSPGQGAKYVKDGTIRGGDIWNPTTAGEIFVQLGKMLAEGKEPTDGLELVGVGPVKVDTEKRIIQARKLEPLDKENIDRLVEMGL